MDALHRHPRIPEEQDVEAGDEQVVGVVALPKGRGPAPPLPRYRALHPASPAWRRATGRRRTRCRARPRRGSTACCPARTPAPAFLISATIDRAVRVVPSRDPVPPPQLPRDAPGLDVLHPVEEGLFPALSARSRCAVSHRLDRGPAARVAASTYHWSVSHGSITTPPRSPIGRLDRARFGIVQ
jgi:hypothetical protein